MSISSFFRVSSQSGYRQKSAEDYTKVAIGAGAGAVLGGAVGGVMAYDRAAAEVEKIPTQSVTEQWQTPVTHDKVIGQIPNDYYTPNNGFGISVQTQSLHDVSRPVPVTTDGGAPSAGNVQWDSHTQTFTGHGNPLVNWTEHRVTVPHLVGSTSWDVNDTDTWTDGRGVEHDHLNGTWHRFSPDVRDMDTGVSYKTPDVTFENGVGVAGRTFVGLAVGAAVGATAGALVGIAVKKFTES